LTRALQVLTRYLAQRSLEEEAMFTATTSTRGKPADNEAVRTLYRNLLESWNRQNASDMAALFVDDANVIGFDGSQLDGRQAIEAEMARIFRDHPTGAYVGIVREVRFLTADVAVLRAIAGLIPHGQVDLNPALNTVQTLVAVHANGWRVAVYQNTPAALHGRPELVQAMTEELRRARTR
jgi:uncharacterized protein (TIGR02246 family)